MTSTGKRYPCPCCGYYTLDEQPPGSYDICLVCYWQDDLVQFEDPDYPGGANEVCLRKARENFRKMGVSDPWKKRFVRAPLLEEFPEKNIDRTDK